MKLKFAKFKTELGVPQKEIINTTKTNTAALHKNILQQSR